MAIGIFWVLSPGSVFAGGFGFHFKKAQSEEKKAAFYQQKMIMADIQARNAKTKEEKLKYQILAFNFEKKSTKSTEKASKNNFHANEIIKRRIEKEIRKAASYEHKMELNEESSRRAMTSAERQKYQKLAVHCEKMALLYSQTASVMGAQKFLYGKMK